MWALPGGRLPKIVMSVGVGVATVAALSVAALADSSAGSSGSSAGSSGHGRLLAAAASQHRQRVSHFNVARTHSLKLLRELAGHSGKPKNGVTDNMPGAGLAGAAQGVDVAAY